MCGCCRCSRHSAITDDKLDWNFIAHSQDGVGALDGQSQIRKISAGSVRFLRANSPKLNAENNDTAKERFHFRGHGLFRDYVPLIKISNSNHALNIFHALALKSF